MDPSTSADSTQSDLQSLFLHYPGLRDSRNASETLSEPQNLEIAAGQSYAAALLEIRTELDLPESLFKCALLRTRNGNKFRVAPSAWRFLKPGEDLELEVVRKALDTEEKPKPQVSGSTGKASPSRPSRPFAQPISPRSLATSAAGRPSPTSDQHEDCVVPATPSNSDMSETEDGDDEREGGLGERRGGAQSETGGTGQAKATTTPVEMLDRQTSSGQHSGDISTTTSTSERASSSHYFSPSADVHMPAEPAQSLAKSSTALQPPPPSAQHQANPELLPHTNLPSSHAPPASSHLRDFPSSQSQLPPAFASDQSTFGFSNIQDNVRHCRSPSPSPSFHSERSLIYKEQMQRRAAEHLTVAPTTTTTTATIPALGPLRPVPQVELSSLQPKPSSSGPRSSQTAAESDVSYCVGVDASGQIGFVPRSPAHLRQRQGAVVEQDGGTVTSPRADKGKRRAQDDSSSDDEVVVAPQRRVEHSSDDEITSQRLTESSSSDDDDDVSLRHVKKELPSSQHTSFSPTHTAAQNVPRKQHSSSLFSSSLPKPSPSQPFDSTSAGSLHPIASTSAKPYASMTSSLHAAPVATTLTSALASNRRPASASRIAPRKRARTSLTPVPPTGPAPSPGRNASQSTFAVEIPPPSSPHTSHPSTSSTAITTTSRATPAKRPRAPRPSLTFSQRQALARGKALARPRVTPPAFPRSGRFCLYLRLPNWPIGPRWADAGLHHKLVLTFGAQGPNRDQTLGCTLNRVFEHVAKETGWAVKDLRLRYTAVRDDDVDGDGGEHEKRRELKWVYGFDEIFTSWRDLEEWGVTDNALLDVDFVPYDPLRPWDAPPEEE
ncbi:hypothetical protein JCM5296_004955 [Sporobolomyces johnsonii]